MNESITQILVRNSRHIQWPMDYVCALDESPLLGHIYTQVLDNFCTPTSCVPVWMTDEWLDVYKVIQVMQ